MTGSALFPTDGTDDNQKVAKSKRIEDTVAGFLHLAAAPVFVTMALLTAITDQVDAVCSSTQGAFALNGMMTMYLLMSAIHLSPWLRLTLYTLPSERQF
jgi:hypothetical protein